MGLDHQYRLCGAAQSRHPAARRGDRTRGQYALPGRSGLAGSVGTVPGVSQLRLAPRQSAPTVAGPRRHQWPWRSQAVAAVYPGDGARLVMVSFTYMRSEADFTLYEPIQTAQAAA